MQSPPFAQNPFQVSSPTLGSITWLTRPWEDKEVSGGLKLLIFTGVFVLFFALIIFVVPIQESLPMDYESSTLLLIVLLVIGLIIVLYVLRQLQSLPTKYKPKTAPIAPDLIGEEFNVMFQGMSFARTLRGKGLLRFSNDGIEMNGTLPPSPLFQVVVFVVVTVVPLIVFGIGLGIIPALLIASYLGRKDTYLVLPYNAVNLDLKGRTIELRSPGAEPSKMKFRLGTDDGERFYRGCLALHVPGTVASFKV